mmetsp:Transcript_36469/g.81170  ORF Transcript_36469/g.81170 Transcript_36469/m.81170 type:complete len:621 (+) Transcript_36469:366-2228(+)
MCYTGSRSCNRTADIPSTNSTADCHKSLEHHLEITEGCSTNSSDVRMSPNLLPSPTPQLHPNSVAGRSDAGQGQSVHEAQMSPRASCYGPLEASSAPPPSGHAHPPAVAAATNSTSMPGARATWSGEDKAVAWAHRNPWFGSIEDMTEYAFLVHDQLVDVERLDASSDLYYTELERRVALQFPVWWVKQGRTPPPAGQNFKPQPPSAQPQQTFAQPQRRQSPALPDQQQQQQDVAYATMVVAPQLLTLAHAPMPAMPSVALSGEASASSISSAFPRLSHTSVDMHHDRSSAQSTSSYASQRSGSPARRSFGSGLKVHVKDKVPATRWSRGTLPVLYAGFNYASSHASAHDTSPSHSHGGSSASGSCSSYSACSLPDVGSRRVSAAGAVVRPDHHKLSSLSRTSAPLPASTRPWPRSYEEAAVMGHGQSRASAYVRSSAPQVTSSGVVCKDRGSGGGAADRSVPHAAYYGRAAAAAQHDVHDSSSILALEQLLGGRRYHEQGNLPYAAAIDASSSILPRLPAPHQTPQPDSLSCHGTSSANKLSGALVGAGREQLAAGCLPDQGAASQARMGLYEAEGHPSSSCSLPRRSPHAALRARQYDHYVAYNPSSGCSVVHPVSPA